MRWIMLLLTLPLLGACNLVTSPNPLFTEADAVGAPTLREGLWIAKGEDCEVDTTAPADKWPDCARWFVVQDGRVRSLEKAGSSRAGEWSEQPYLLAAGKPPVMQIDFRQSLQEAAILQSEGFLYQALSPTGFDETGRVTAFDRWFVNCGPPPPLDQKQPTKRTGQTRRPFKGMILHKKDANCTALTAEPVRRAAAASRGFDMINTNVWVRDGYP